MTLQKTYIYIMYNLSILVNISYYDVMQATSNYSTHTSLANLSI
jgi:hypothetical protein